MKKYAVTFLAYRRLYLLVMFIVVVGWPIFGILRGLQQISTIGGSIQATPRLTHTTTGESFPKRLHQIWMGYDDMPHNWNKTIKTTTTMNADAIYKVWSREDIQLLLEEHYPWFLDTYHSYSQPIQKVDVARYFILHHHGGVYIDMDVGSRKSVSYIIQQHNLTDYDCLLPESKPIGFSNDLMMCKRGSPFMSFVTSRLSASNRWYLLPYATVMFSTGPAFLSQALADYNKKESIFILSNTLYTRTYFYHIPGSTWHSWDANLVKWFYTWSETLTKYPVRWTIMICFTVLCLALAFRKTRLKSQTKLV